VHRETDFNFGYRHNPKPALISFISFMRITQSASQKAFLDFRARRVSTVKLRATLPMASGPHIGIHIIHVPREPCAWESTHEPYGWLGRVGRSRYAIYGRFARATGDKMGRAHALSLLRQ